MSNAQSLIIGYSFNVKENAPVLIVGRKTVGQAVEVINAFQGEEAEELYLKLTTKKESMA